MKVEYCGDDRDDIPAINSMLLKGLLQPVVSVSVNAVNAPRLVEIEGFQVDLFLAGVLLVFSTLDLPGVMGSVGSILGKHDINVEHFRWAGNNPEERHRVWLQ